MFTQQPYDYDTNFLNNYAQWGNSPELVNNTFWDAWKNYGTHFKTPEAVNTFNSLADRFGKNYRIRSGEEAKEYAKKLRAKDIIWQGVNNNAINRDKVNELKTFYPDLDVANPLSIYDLALDLEKEFGYETVIPSSNYGRAFRDKMSDLKQQPSNQKIAENQFKDMYRNETYYNNPAVGSMLKDILTSINKKPSPGVQETKFLHDPAAMQTLENMLPAYVAMRNQLNQVAEGEQHRYITKPQTRNRFKHVMSNLSSENFQAGLDPNAQYLPYHLRRT